VRAAKAACGSAECCRICGGAAKAVFQTCDLAHGYIDINASYRT